MKRAIGPIERGKRIDRPASRFCNRCLRALANCSCDIDPHLYAFRVLMFPEEFDLSLETLSKGGPFKP